MAAKKEIISDYIARAKSERENGWTCVIDTLCDTLIVISNPEYPNDEWVFRNSEADDMLACIPEWIQEEMNPEDYFLSQIMNW